MKKTDKQKIYCSFCGVPQEDVDLLIDVETPESIVVGRTGAGKSALLLKVQDSVYKSKMLDPNDISIRFLEYSDIIQFFDSIGVYQQYSDVQANIAYKWLVLLGMEDKADEPFRQLSYGDQRLLLIARAMVKHPQLLILDEPCQGLDELNRQLELALIAKVCDQSETTVLYVNHHQEDRVTGIERELDLASLSETI